MAWYSKIRSLFGQPPIHEAAGRGRRSLAWMPGNPGAVAAMLATNTDLRIKSRDLVRRNAWAQSGIEAFVANAVGTGIKPQSLASDERFKTDVQALWRDWVEEADAAGQTDFYGLQALACRAMLEGGECLIRLRPRRPKDGLVVPLQLQLLEAAIEAPGFARGGPACRRQYLAVKWIPQGWQWVDPEKEFKAMLLAIRAGLMSRSEAISAFGYDAEDVDREIAADHQRADDLGLVFDSDPRQTSKDGTPKDGGGVDSNRHTAASDAPGSTSTA
jgi:capsid protein